MELTHASFFSGVGGLDLGLERAGWRTVSFSEIDPYASAVLAERWPGVPNLGDVVQLASGPPDAECLEHDARHATLWSGGFPCQDLSVAGKRAGFAGERSSLAFAFLDLVERHRPPAILLENVPGLLSSNGGKDFGALLGRLAELGYGWAYRILDAQYFGVPQRRRRVFILAFHVESGLGADSAAEVLSVGSRCDGHSATSDEAGEGPTRRPRPGVDLVGALDGTFGHHGVAHSAQSASVGHYVADVAGSLKQRDYRSVDAEGAADGKLISRAIHTSQGRRSGPAGDEVSGLIFGPSPDPGGVREADGLAGRLDDREVVGPLLSGSGGQRTTDLNLPLTFVKRARVSGPGTPESWEEGGVMPTLNSFDVGDIRTTATILGEGPADDPMLPLGIDSHRYRCCGNGVVSNVSEWIGVRLTSALSGVEQ